METYAVVATQPARLRVPTRLEGMETAWLGAGNQEHEFRPDLRGWKHRVPLLMDDNLRVPTRLEGMETAPNGSGEGSRAAFRPDLRGWKLMSLACIVPPHAKVPTRLEGMETTRRLTSLMKAMVFRPDLRGLKPFARDNRCRERVGSDPT